MSAAGRGREGRETRVLLCAGNADDATTATVLENLMVALAQEGASPLAVFDGAPPFTGLPARVGLIGGWGRHVERFTSARIPGIPLDQLVRGLPDFRRHPVMDEAPGPGIVFLQGPDFPADRLCMTADALLLLMTMEDSSPAWVYAHVHALRAQQVVPPVNLVFLGAEHLEEAALRFTLLRDEAQGLLKSRLDIRFAGFIRIDRDQERAARATGRSLVECFPDTPFHGQVRRAGQALVRSTNNPSSRNFFSRVESWIGGESGGRKAV